VRFLQKVGGGAGCAFRNKIRGPMSISRLLKRHSNRGSKMPTYASVMETGNEWGAAREVQQGFMRHPGPAIDGLDYCAQCRQMLELGGDCFDFMPLGERRMALAVGDASGKGLAAALMISNVQSSLRTAALFTGNDAAAAVTVVNRQAYASSLADRYATLFYGVFDGVTGTLRYVNAGHNPPMVIRRNGSIEWLESGGAPVGMFSDWSYEQGSAQLDPGDVVVAYTDGVIEAVNPAGEEWGVEGLRRVASERCALTADDMVDAILRNLDDFSHGRQTDDRTVVVLRYCLPSATNITPIMISPSPRNFALVNSSPKKIFDQNAPST
jgi:sigma-B regulation protein RsbU (phosphoserine phosphatase)